MIEFIGLSLASIIGLCCTMGSVISFNNDVVRRKENGLLFCYFCNRQIDPLSRAVNDQKLDPYQTLIGFHCTSCRKNNYFPIPPRDKVRAKVGNAPYGKVKQLLKLKDGLK